MLDNLLYESTNKKAVVNLQTLINEDLAIYFFKK